MPVEVSNGPVVRCELGAEWEWFWDRLGWFGVVGVGGWYGMGGGCVEWSGGGVDGLEWYGVWVQEECTRLPLPLQPQRRRAARVPSGSASVGEAGGGRRVGR
eukprot:gene17352-biopygen15893